jgi:hypothetical protein
MAYIKGASGKGRLASLLRAEALIARSLFLFGEPSGVACLPPKVGRAFRDCPSVVVAVRTTTDTALVAAAVCTSDAAWMQKGRERRSLASPHLADGIGSPPTLANYQTAASGRRFLFRDRLVGCQRDNSQTMRWKHHGSSQS